MKRTLLTIGLLAALAALTGCAMFSKTATPAEKQAEVQQLCYAAASVGVTVALEEEPGIQARLLTAYQQLNDLVQTKAVTGDLLRQIVVSLPVKELKSSNAKIAIESATMLYNLTVGTKLSIESQPYALAAATGLRDGMKTALGQ